MRSQGSRIWITFQKRIGALKPHILSEMLPASIATIPEEAKTPAQPIVAQESL